MADNQSAVPKWLQEINQEQSQARQSHGLLGKLMHKTKIPGFKHGGKVKKTGVYKLHKGERVMTAKESKSHPCLDC